MLLVSYEHPSFDNDYQLMNENPFLERCFNCGYSVNFDCGEWWHNIVQEDKIRNRIPTIRISTSAKVISIDRNSRYRIARANRKEKITTIYIKSFELHKNKNATLRISLNDKMKGNSFRLWFATLKNQQFIFQCCKCYQSALY